jgi:hypothetical protein
MIIRQFAVAASVSAVALASLAAGATASIAPAAGGSVALASIVASLPTVQSGVPVSQLVGQWQAENGRGVLLLQNDGTYAYAVRIGSGQATIDTEEGGVFQVNGSQLILTPTDRIGTSGSGSKVQFRLDPLLMSIGTDSSGNLTLDLNGSIYHRT